MLKKVKLEEIEYNVTTEERFSHICMTKNSRSFPSLMILDKILAGFPNNDNFPIFLVISVPGNWESVYGR
jgi:hypothetical protein